MITVERTDFVSVPVTDMERSKRFYGETLGLPLVSGDDAWPEYQLGENVSLYLIDPTNIGQAFTAPHSSHDRAARAGRGGGAGGARERRASSSTARSSTPASATWPSSAIPTGTR